MSWEIKKLNECCISIADGDHLPPPKSETGVPFVTIANVDSYNHFDFTDTMFVPQSYYDKLDDKRKARTGDILLTVVGSFGIPILITDNTPFVFQRHIAILRPDPKVIDSRFLYYTMLSKSFYAQADAFAVGAAQRTISLTSLRQMKIAVPELDIQKEIADTLSMLDNLIDNNNKQIKTLEQMAENLYKEWFVRFRFPNHENTEFENGIPKDWKNKQLGEELTIKRGGSPRPIQEYLTDNGLKWLKISDATKNDNPFVFNIEESIKEEGLRKTVYMKKGSLVLSNSATPGLPRILALDTCIHDGWLYFENQKLSNEFLFLFFNYIRPQLVNKGNGAVFTNLKTDILKKYYFVRPTDDILSQFDGIVQPIFKQIHSITEQNNNLIKQRDLLLPRLMSGKLEV